MAWKHEHNSRFLYDINQAAIVDKDIFQAYSKSLGY
jgi:hypothetical protein